MSAEFRRAFVLAQVPPKAQLSLRAFRQCVLHVNGLVVEQPGAPHRNWKEPRIIDIVRYLRPGKNMIAVSVINRRGPPALWLDLKGEGWSIRSDESWAVSYAGAHWRQARLAERPMAATSGNPLVGGETVLGSLPREWPTLVGLTLLASVILVGGAWWFAGDQRKGRHAGSVLLSDPAVWTLAASIALWILLFSNNLPLLPPYIGFDAHEHLSYIRYILDNKALPLPQEGMTMHNPPLYYVVGAMLLRLLSMSPSDSDGIMALRLLGLASGIGHLVYVFRSMRLLLPGQPGTQAVGVLLAGLMPCHVYVVHYVTNEPMAAMLVGGTIYHCLKLLREEQPSLWRFGNVAAWLGAALLTKTTALVSAPFIFGAMAWKLVKAKETRVSRRLCTIGMALAVCIAVCGWHYAGVWTHHGTPLILGAADPASGHYWWQDEGYRTTDFFLRFGAALASPMFSGFEGFVDGIYSTLWGDGLCGGTAALDHRPPWNYGLMAVGYWLSLLPSALILIGASIALLRWVTQPSPESLLVPGVVFAFAVVFIYSALRVPFYSQIKAFYGLITLLPVCALGAAGWSALTNRGRVLRWCCSMGLGIWAMNVAATFWIHPEAARTQTMMGITLSDDRRHAEAVLRFEAALRADTNDVNARSSLVSSLRAMGRHSEARQVIEEAVRMRPTEAIYHLDLASVHETNGDMEEAIAHTRRATELAPDHPFAWVQLTRRLEKLERFSDVEQAAREGLRVAPSQPELHLRLGLARAELAKFSGIAPQKAVADGDSMIAEAVMHLRLAVELAPQWPLAGNSLARILATHSGSPVAREGSTGPQSR